MFYIVELDIVVEDTDCPKNGRQISVSKTFQKGQVERSSEICNEEPSGKTRGKN